jgi:hypothetical protein
VDPLLGRGRDAQGAIGQVEGLLASRFVAHEVVEKAGVGAVLRVADGVPVVGVDADARPAEVLLQVEGRTVLFPVVTADVHEEAVPPVGEEVADDELFVELGVELLSGAEQIVVRLRRRAAEQPPQHETGDDPEDAMFVSAGHRPDPSRRPAPPLAGSPGKAAERPRSEPEASEGRSPSASDQRARGPAKARGLVPTPA